MSQPYAVAERLFDGIAILPRHLLEKAQAEGRLAQAWGLGTPPAAMAGMGPFRLRSYVPGERFVFERNPHYWKVDAAGRRLPYLDEIVILLVRARTRKSSGSRPGDRPHQPGGWPTASASLRRSSRRGRSS